MANAQQVLEIQEAVKYIKVAEAIKEYIAEIVALTREHNDLTLGASPGGALALMRACQAFALLEGRDYVMPDDVQRWLPRY